MIAVSCNVPRTTSTKAPDTGSYSSIENPEQSISLADHLRRVSGVQVVGSGNNAKVTIRGIHSFYGDNEPLFVVNGQPLAGGLSTASQTVPVANIKSIRVLKNAEDIGFYGVRGANGVIEITMKSAGD